MHPKDADGMANSVDPDLSSLIWVYTICPDLPVRKIRNIHNMSCLMTKPTKWHVPPSKTQISLGICPVWSESSLSAWRKLGSLATHWAHSEDSGQTGQMTRLIWVLAGCTGHFVDFVMQWLMWYFKMSWDTAKPSVYREGSDQPAHLFSLIRIFTVCVKKHWVLGYQ